MGVTVAAYGTFVPGPPRLSIGGRTSQIHVVQNWHQELKARVPVP